MGISQFPPSESTNNSGSSVGGGSTFIIDIGDSGNTTVSFLSSKAAGTYTISSALDDASYDIYLVAPDGSYAGNNTGNSVAATQSFNKLVVYSATQNDVLTFEYKETASPSDHGTQITGVAPYLTSATPTTLESIDDTATITGGNFAEDVEIDFVGTDSLERPAKSLVRSSSTELIVTRPDILPPAYEPYSLVATNPGIPNPSTSVNTLSSIIDAGGPLTWVTTILPPIIVDTAYSATLQATDADGQPASYSVVSGSLPSGLTLNSSTGVISGTPASDPQTFTVRALDSGGNTLDREFSLQLPPTVSGGTLYSDSTYYYRKFTSTGDLVVENSELPCDFMIIAGGGGGGSYSAGGGGAGGFRVLTSQLLAPGTYSATIGAGGAANANGVDSSFAGYSNTGGGRGGSYSNQAAGDGGSGGGGRGAFGQTSYPGGLGVVGQGNNGGAGSWSNSSTDFTSGGGGGGAGGAGSNASSNNGAAGGSGTGSYSTWASATSSGVGGYYAGGGAGTAYRYGGLGSGGSGGGGGGGVAGTVNTGSGGGGGRDVPSVAPAAGGSGLVIVRYTKESVGG